MLFCSTTDYTLAYYWYEIPITVQLLQCSVIHATLHPSSINIVFQPIQQQPNFVYNNTKKSWLDAIVSCVRLLHSKIDAFTWTLYGIQAKQTQYSVSRRPQEFLLLIQQVRCRREQTSSGRYCWFTCNTHGVVVQLSQGVAEKITIWQKFSQRVWLGGRRWSKQCIGGVQDAWIPVLKEWGVVHGVKCLLLIVIPHLLFQKTLTQYAVHSTSYNVHPARPQG